MSQMVSRWPVLLTLAVEAEELDGDGRLTDPAVERLFAEARREYFSTVDLDVTLEAGVCRIQSRDAAIADGLVIVSTKVTEVYPSSLRMEARMRPMEGGDIAADATCVLEADRELPKANVDALIARAHAAPHIN